MSTIYHARMISKTLALFWLSPSPLIASIPENSLLELGCSYRQAMQRRLLLVFSRSRASLYMVNHTYTYLPQKRRKSLEECNVVPSHHSSNFGLSAFWSTLLWWKQLLGHVRSYNCISQEMSNLVSRQAHVRSTYTRKLNCFFSWMLRVAVADNHIALLCSVSTSPNYTNLNQIEKCS